MKLQLHSSSPKVGTEDLLQTLNYSLSAEAQTVRSIGMGVGVGEENWSASLLLSLSLLWRIPDNYVKNQFGKPVHAFKMREVFWGPCFSKAWFCDKFRYSLIHYKIQ